MYTNLDANVLNFARSTDAASLSVQNFNQYLAQNQISASMAAKGLTVLKGVGITLLATLASAAVNKGIDLFLSKVNDYIHQSEIIAQKSQQAQARINEITAAYRTNADAVNKIKSRFSELSQGIEQAGNTINNVHLTTDEFQEYLSMSNQLAAFFPSLVNGYDSQGNAILNLGGNYESIISTLDTFIEKQHESANLEVKNNMSDLWSGVANESKNNQAAIQNLERQKNQYQKMISDINDTDFINKLGNGLLSKNFITSNTDELERYRKILSGLNLDMTSNFVSQDTDGTPYFSVFVQNTEKEINDALKHLPQLTDKFNVEYNNLLQQIQDKNMTYGLMFILNQGNQQVVHCLNAFRSLINTSPAINQDATILIMSIFG